MQIIPLASVPSQTLTTVLEQQNCAINVYQKTTGLYLDLTKDGQPVISGVLCRDRVRLVRQAYLGFSGDLAFVDTQGVDDPAFQGLGNRWVLVYFDVSELDGE